MVSGIPTFADIVQKSGEPDFLDLHRVHAQRLRDHHGVARNLLRMAFGV